MNPRQTKLPKPSVASPPALAGLARIWLERGFPVRAVEVASCVRAQPTARAATIAMAGTVAQRGAAVTAAWLGSGTVSGVASESALGVSSVLMQTPDLARARDYALGRLARELPPTLTYHSLFHTRDEVVPAAERLAAAAGLDGELLLLLRTAALFHDLGYVERYPSNEAIAVRIAGEVLPALGYSPAQLRVLAELIMATQPPQQPPHELAAMLIDADLASLSSDIFFDRSEALRAELAAAGIVTTPPAQWLVEQRGFLAGHHFFSEVGRRLGEAGKQRNAAQLEVRLAVDP